MKTGLKKSSSQLFVAIIILVFPAFVYAHPCFKFDDLAVILAIFVSFVVIILVILVFLIRALFFKKKEEMANFLEEE